MAKKKGGKQLKSPAELARCSAAGERWRRGAPEGERQALQERNDLGVTRDEARLHRLRILIGKEVRWFYQSTPA